MFTTSESSSSTEFITSEDYFENQLSLSLSEIFYSDIPDFVDKNREWLWKIGKDFLCCLCDKTIETSSFDSVNRKNFEKHFTSEDHVNRAAEYHNRPHSTYEIREMRVRDQLTELYDPDEVPPYVYDSMEYIGFRGDYFYCTLCNKYLQNSYEDLQIKLQMRSHLTSRGHKYILHEKNTDNYKTPAEMYCLSVKNSLADLFEGKLPNFVINSIDYIDKDADNDNDYYCYLCNKCLQTSQDLDITVRNFKNHLCSTGHKCNVNTYVLQAPKTGLERYLAWICKLLEINFYNDIPYYVNKCINYFGGDAPHWFYCSLCDEYMEIFKTKNDVLRIINLKSHLNSGRHNYNLRYI